MSVPFFQIKLTVDQTARVFQIQNCCHALTVDFQFSESLRLHHQRLVIEFENLSGDAHPVDQLDDEGLGGLLGLRNRKFSPAKKTCINFDGLSEQLARLPVQFIVGEGFDFTKNGIT